MLMTPKQLAGLLGITPQCVTAWCRAGYMIERAIEAQAGIKPGKQEWPQHQAA